MSTVPYNYNKFAFIAAAKGGTNICYAVNSLEYSNSYILTLTQSLHLNMLVLLSAECIVMYRMVTLNTLQCDLRTSERRGGGSGPGTSQLKSVQVSDYNS